MVSPQSFDQGSLTNLEDAWMWYENVIQCIFAWMFKTFEDRERNVLV